MSTEESGSARERELRLTVAQLRQQLEEEKRARKRDHSDKVRDLKAAREREQEAAKETIEELKMKQQREKTQEMTALQERMTRDFKAQVKEIQRKNEEEKHGLQKELEKERRNFKEQRKAMEKEIQRQMRQGQEAEQKKVAQEMFVMSSNLSDMEVKLRDTLDADCTKAEVIREMKAEHRAELESLSHSSRLSNRQQLEELSASQRELKEKDREISGHMERIRRLEADNDKLRDEVRTLRRAESWAKSSVTPPTLTPSTSVGDITSQPPRQYTPKERDMVLKNTELSFRVRQLEEKNSELERFKRELKELLEKAKAEQKPLKEQLAKQGVRVNSLSASLHDKEKLVKRVTEENEELIKANRQLTQEQSQQKHRLTQQMTQTHTQRMEHQRALGKYADLHKLHKKLQLRVRELEHQRRSNSHQASAASSPSGGVWGVGGEPCSPSVSFSSLASVTEEGDAQHITAKYTEMKTEYKKVKEHYKVLKISYEKLESKYRLAEQEKLTIESEISQLRASPVNERDSPYDAVRSSSILSENMARLKALQSRVKDLEAYILEQESLVSKEREEHAREVSSLTEARDRLQETLRGIGGWEEREEGEGEEVSAGDERSRGLLEQLGRVEEMNRKTSASLKETMEKTKDLEKCGNQMNETLQGIRTLDTPPGDNQGEEEEEEEGGLEREGSLLVLRKAREALKECQELLRSGQDVSQVVERLADVLGVDRPLSLLEDTSLAMTTSDLELPTPVDSSTPATAHSSLVAQIARLQEELSEKQEVLEKAQEKVAGLQTLTVELERQLEEEREERENLVATWDQEMADLQAQVSQRETQLKRVRRAIPQGVNEQMHQQLGQQVLHNLQQCKSLAGGLTGAQALLSQLEVLETSLDSLLHTVFPGMFQQLTSPPPPLLPPPPSPPRPHTSSTTTAEPSQSTNENGSVASHQDPSSPPTATTDVPTDHSPASSITSSRHSTPHSDQVEVTPLSSPSSHTPPQSPETEVPHLPVGTATKPSPPHHTPPHYPTLPSSPLHETIGKATPPGPVEEVMVMRHVECEEISIPLDFLLETTPTDSTHSEPHPSHTPPKSPVHTSSETDSHSTSNDLNTTVEDIGQLVEQSEDGPSYSAITSAMAGEKGGEPEEVHATEGIPQRDNPLFNGPTHPPTPDLTLIGGREYTKEDLDEVDLGTSGEYSMGASGEYSGLIRTSGEYGGTEEKEEYKTTSSGWAGRKSLSPLPPGKDGSLPLPAGKGSPLSSLEGNDTLSPSLHYPTPPEAPAGRQRVLAAHAAARDVSCVSPSSYVLGKKRVRTQSMEQEEMKEEEKEGEEGDGETGPVRAGRRQRKLRGEEGRGKDERLFVAILSYNPEAMCTTGRPDLELLFDEGSIIAVEGGVDDNGFHRGSFQGKTGLVPAGFVQEMEVEDEAQRRRLLNQTLSRPYIPSLPSSPFNTPFATSRPPSGSLLFSPSGSLLSHTPLSQTTSVTSPPPPSSVTVETTRQKNIVMVTWAPPTTPQSSEVTGYHIFANKQLRASVTSPQTRVLLSDVSEVSLVMVGVASYNRDGRQSSVASTTYHPPTSTPQPQQQPQQPEQYRLCIVLVDYDPQKMSPSDNPDLELKVSEGNLLRCYNRDGEEDSGFTMAELGESNTRGLVPTEFITEVYGPSASDPNKYEWKSPPQSSLPATFKLMKAVYDYNSRQDSPNRGMELELSFRNGDVITVYGSMDSDGFYTGQVREAFGLVPSNYLQKEEKKEGEMQRQQSTDGEAKKLKKWELPPNMWKQVNGQELHLNALASSHPRSQSEVDGPKKKGSSKASEGSISGSGSGSGNGHNGEGSKRRWSYGLPFKNPFSRKKSDSVL